MNLRHEWKVDARTGLPPGLIDLVFSWSLDDISNQYLYSDKIVEIPVSFRSASHYLSSFVLPLVEDVRALLFSSLEVISKAPFSKVESIKPKATSADNTYEVTVESCWQGGTISESYRPSYGDVFVVTDVKPEAASDLSQHGRSFVMASIVKVNDRGKSVTNFTIKAAKNRDLCRHRWTQKSLFLVFLLNLTTSRRIWEALHTIGVPGNANLIDVVLGDRPRVEGTCNICYASIVNSLPALDDSQTAAMVATISDINCDHRRSVRLISGPAGTGKTRIITELLWLILRMKRKALVCGSANYISSFEVSSRLLKLVKQKHCQSKTVDAGALIYPLGDIILCGSTGQLNLSRDSDLYDIYLDNRVKRLVECVDQLTGWDRRFSALFDFLESCVSLCHEHIENENVLNLHILRGRFRVESQLLGECINYLSEHLPISIVSGSTFDGMVGMLNLLQFYGMLLSDLEDTLRSIGHTNNADNNLVGSDENPFEDYLISEHTIMVHALILLSEAHGKCVEKIRLFQSSVDIPWSCDKEMMKNMCLRSASIIFCTTATSFRLIGSMPFDLLVIDDAPQLKECESIIPLQHAGIQHALFVGDECQLHATVKSKFSEEVGFGRSLFERLSLLAYPKHILKVQYRMHPSISLFPSRTFYSGQVLDAASVTIRDNEVQYFPGRMYGPYAFINVCDGREERDETGNSKKDLVEVAVVAQLVQNLFNARCEGRRKLSIGVVSADAVQVALVQKKLMKYDNEHNFVVKVQSVDGFLGGEEDVIIISTVRSNNNGAIGILSNPQVANVAVTRARHCLWIVGNSSTLIKSGSVWEALVRDAEDRHCFFNASDDGCLLEVITKVKRELGQMHDLLNEDSVLFRNARWKVLFSDNFKCSFTKIKSTQGMEMVLKMLLRLAGGWRPRNYISDVSNDGSKKLIRQYKIGDHYVICTVDVVKYAENMQVLKIWDILPLFEIPMLVKRLMSLFALYSEDSIMCCKMKRMDGRLEVPIRWRRDADFKKYKCIGEAQSNCNDLGDGFSEHSNYGENSEVCESLLLMKFYSLSSDVVGHLLTGCDGRELELPFEVFDMEHDIITFPKSAFILGRSGTGKTTVLTMKLVQREQVFSLSREGTQLQRTSMESGEGMLDRVHDNSSMSDGNMLQQLFVTVSSKLCSAIKSHVSRLKRFACGGGYSADHGSLDMLKVDGSMGEFADIPDSFTNVPSRYFPLVVTLRKFLVMLDGSVGISFFSRFHDLTGVCFERKRLWRSPVFHAFMRQREVNYGRFASVYWPHFNKRLTSRVDSLNVFKEIISNIKGGTCDTCDNVLSQGDYFRMSENRSSTLNCEIRELVYEIFMVYEKKKKINGEYDLSDFVIDLHRRLKENGGYFGAKMDFLYVDEVQDLTMKQVALFKYVCRNFEEGLAFAGDTAQTISHEIDFRFEDIRSLFYTQFLSRSEEGVSNKGKVKESISDMFHLNMNYRTHSGILKLSQSILDLLYSFFPLSVDRLLPEYSLINGEAPLLLECNDENPVFTIFRSSESCGRSNNSFGAEQVILVRDDSSKQERSIHAQEHALVLTLLECKGLEFQDVLLYNFFGSSPLRCQWRVIYSYMNSHNLLDQRSSMSFPHFEMGRHGLLCSELKQLYVAITRTRQRLWICETDEEYAKPMFDYWKKLGLVQTRQLDGSFIESIFVASSNSEWRDRGFKLFREGNYEMATMCFDRAGDVYGKKWAKAASLHSSGSRFLCTNFEEGRSALIQAAEIYEDIGKLEIAVECYIESKDFKRAGIIYMEKYGETRLEEAGDCFLQARCFPLAAEAYGRAKIISKYLTACLKGRLFDLGLKFIECRKMENMSQHANANEEDVDKMNSYLKVCAQRYRTLKDKRNLMKCISYFSSLKYARDFLKDQHWYDELAIIEVERGNFKKAAQAARLKGDCRLEARMLEKAKFYDDRLQTNFERDRSALIDVAEVYEYIGEVGIAAECYIEVGEYKRAGIIYMEKCGQTRLEEAGDLLFQAQCFSLAAKAYGRAKIISKCLTACLKGRLLDLGLEFIECWRMENMYQRTDANEEDVDKMNSFLKDCAHHYRTLTDKRNLMKCIRNFSSLEYARSFLEDQHCCDELEVTIVYLRKWAMAGRLRSSASSVLSRNILEGRSTLNKAAEMYEDIGEVEVAAECYIQSKEYKRAGTIYMEKCGESRLEEAGHCFFLARCFPLAAEAYGRAKIISKCLTACSKGKLFDMGLKFIECWKMGSISQHAYANTEAVDKVNSFLKDCARHYRTHKDKVNLMKCIRIFSSLEYARGFLEDRHWYDVLVIIEEELGNFEEAARALQRLKVDRRLKARVVE